jgi:hypothetical protein
MLVFVAASKAGCTRAYCRVESIGAIRINSITTRTLRHVCLHAIYIGTEHGGRDPTGAKSALVEQRRLCHYRLVQHRILSDPYFVLRLLDAADLSALRNHVLLPHRQLGPIRTLK